MIRLRLFLLFVIPFQVYSQALFLETFDTTSTAISTINWPMNCRYNAPSMNTNTVNCSMGKDYAVALTGINSRIISLPISIPSDEYEITFEYAYNGTSGTPALEILSGSGCGTRFESANGLPKTDDTCNTHTIDLAQYAGKNLVFCFSSKSTADTFFLDKINVCHKNGCDILNSITEIANNIEIYPNPASTFISLNVHTNTLVEISNSTGIVLQNHLLSGATDIDIHDLEKGIYFIRFKNDGNIISRKIIIE